MRRFHLCIHDATPAYASEIRAMLRDVVPVLGRRLSFAVVPDWHGHWPLAAHSDFCRLLRESAGDLLLHGYFHQRQRSHGPISMLTGRSDEMNGLDLDETRRTVERAQHVFTETFGAAGRGFVAPAWQAGHVSVHDGNALQLEYVLGFFSLESRAGRKVPLATCTWDCGRWSWLGYGGHGIGRLLRSLDRGVPVLAVHPRDLDRGFWPGILQLTEELVDRGYQPSTLTELLESE